MSFTKYIEDAFIRTAGWTIRDVKFADDDDLLVAASDQGKQPQGRVPTHRHR